MPLLSNVCLALLSTAHAAHCLSFSVPASPPQNASSKLDAAPVGVSIEFFAFPEYFNNLTSTKTCLKNFKDLTGKWPPLRIGGTTQDRATYNASSPNEVTYTVANVTDAPANLTFGPSFMSLADTYKGSVIIGLNRRLDNQPNTIKAAKKARSSITNLNAIELGNEPSLYISTDPIAGGSTWTAPRDFASQTSWQAAVGRGLKTTNIISAGVYLEVNSFNNSGLAQVEGSSLKYVKDFCSHNYPQSPSNANLSALMSHSAIAAQIAPFAGEVDAANANAKFHIMGETNSATGGGGGISPTFGAGLWAMDYSLQLLILGTKRIYFHQGTVGACPYCWWGTETMGTPYYGAYFATLALADADQIAPLDDNSATYAAYAIYKDGKPIRALLYNSDYYVSGTRGQQNFTLTGLKGSKVTAKRLTAPSATSQQAEGQNPSFAGQYFANATCEIEGALKAERYAVSAGKATFTVQASEALLLYL